MMITANCFMSVLIHDFGLRPMTISFCVSYLLFLFLNCAYIWNGLKFSKHHNNHVFNFNFYVLSDCLIDLHLTILRRAQSTHSCLWSWSLHTTWYKYKWCYRWGLWQDCKTAWPWYEEKWRSSYRGACSGRRCSCNQILCKLSFMIIADNDLSFPFEFYY